MTKEHLLVGISSVQHFLVDGLCICCIYLLAPLYDSSIVVKAVLAYNVIAFMSQPFSGMWADRSENCHWQLLLSVVLFTIAVATAAVMTAIYYTPWLLTVVAVMLGAGNSLFHVWGGKQTVAKVGNDTRAVGVFVSTGALGLAIGLVCYSWSLLYMLLLAMTVLSVVYVHCDHATPSPCELQHRLLPKDLSLWKVGALVALMLFVMYRSYAGEVFSKGITKSQELILLIGTASMLGKMAGGWIARYLGVIRSLAVMLAVVALCLLFRNNDVPILLTGVFAMNCTMPVTLYLANKVLNGHEGLAFGLLAAALIPGYLLAVYG